MSATPLPKISNPATRALETIGVTTLDQVTQHSRRELAALHGMGPKGMRILDEALETHGLSYAD